MQMAFPLSMLHNTFRLETLNALILLRIFRSVCQRPFSQKLETFIAASDERTNAQPRMVIKPNHWGRDCSCCHATPEEVAFSSQTSYDLLYSLGFTVIFLQPRRYTNTSHSRLLIWNIVPKLMDCAPSLLCQWFYFTRVLGYSAVGLLASMYSLLSAAIWSQQSS